MFVFGYELQEIEVGNEDQIFEVPSLKGENAKLGAGIKLQWAYSPVVLDLVRVD